MPHMRAAASGSGLSAQTDASAISDESCNKYININAKV